MLIDDASRPSRIPLMPLSYFGLANKMLQRQELPRQNASRDFSTPNPLHPLSTPCRNVQIYQKFLEAALKMASY